MPGQRWLSSPGNPSPVAEKYARLEWTGEALVFQGGHAPGLEVVVDSAGKAGGSPMDYLIVSLAGCMAIDVLMILEKSRVPVEALSVEAFGDRTESEPRRYTSLRLVYEVTGPGAEHQPRLDRAVALSRDKYCSVLHSLRPDIDLKIEIRLG